jgi:hypothetical protein
LEKTLQLFEQPFTNYIGVIMSTKTKMELAIEKKIGQRIEDVRKMPIDEQRSRIEKDHGGKPMEFISEFPFIGSEDVLNDSIINTKYLNGN